MSDPAPIRMDIEWTLPLMMEVAFAGQRKRGLGTWAKIGFIVLFSAFFGFVAFYTGSFYLLIFPAIYIAIPLSQRFAVSRYMKREMAAPLRQGKIRLDLNADGIDTSHPLARSHYAWQLVVDVVEAPLALHLKISSSMSQPIPYASLPDGITREELLKRVEAWRASGAFT